MMNRAVRGKSAATRSTTSVTSAAPPPTRTVTPGGGRQGSGRIAQGFDERLALVPVGSVGRVDGERRQVGLRGRRERRGHVPVARAVGVAVQQGVLAERQARIDVHQAVHPGDAGVCGQSPRVVVERGQVLRRGRRAGRAGGDDDRREFAFAELALEPIEGDPRRDRRRQDRGVRGVEPDMQEGPAEEQQEGQRRDEDRDRVAHDPPSEAGPWPVRLRGDGHLADGQSIHARAQDRQDGGQQGERRRSREPDHDRPRDADRAQDHELEQDQAKQSEQDGHGTEEDGPPGRRHGDPDGIGDLGRAVRCGSPAPRGIGWSSTGSSRRPGPVRAASPG